jgi:hypothetical protein
MIVFRRAQDDRGSKQDLPAAALTLLLLQVFDQRWPGAARRPLVAKWHAHCRALPVAMVSLGLSVGQDRVAALGG